MGTSFFAVVILAGILLNDFLTENNTHHE